MTLKVTDFDGLRVSALSLGTAQFGMDYGIANYRNPEKAGKPPYERACAVLERALAGGITCLDTAQGYGDSELVLGRALDDLGLRDRFSVVTKIRLGRPDVPKDPAEARELVESALQRSCERLKMDRLDLCLLHHGDVELGFLEILAGCRDKGLVRRVGVSVATPAGALRALDSGLVEAMQLPLNMLDRRFRKAGVFRRAHEAGVIVFTRSAFLQGLLVMPIEKIIPELADAVPVCRLLREWAAKAGMSMPELAMRFVMGIEGVSSMLVGVDFPEQLDENLALAGKGPLPPEQIEELDGLIPELREYLIDPPQWPNAKGNDK